MWLGTLRDSFLESFLSGKGVICDRRWINSSYIKAFVSLHHLTNFDFREFLENKSKFTGLYSKSNLSVK